MCRAIWLNGVHLSGLLDAAEKLTQPSALGTVSQNFTLNIELGEVIRDQIQTRGWSRFPAVDIHHRALLVFSLTPSNTIVSSSPELTSASSTEPVTLLYETSISAAEAMVPPFSGMMPCGSQGVVDILDLGQSTDLNGHRLRQVDHVVGSAQSVQHR